MSRNCIVGQSGGPTAAINASLAGVIRGCKEAGFDHIYGMVNGIQGFLDETFLDLKETFDSEESIDTLKKSPAMFLGSCRYKLPEPVKGDQTFEWLFAKFEEMGITDFFYIGGNDSMDTVAKLSRYAEFNGSKVHFIGVPKTIDNDLMGTDHTPGFGSAAKFVATSVLEVVHDSAIYKTDSVTIVEIMGRNAGWLTAASALARTDYSSAPDLIYLPEVPFEKEQFLKDVKEKLKKKRNVIVAVSEGVRNSQGKFLDQDEDSAQKDAFGHVIHSGTGKILENLVRDTIGCKIRSIELNVLQRGAMHVASQTDLEESYSVGKEAVKAAMEGKSNVMMIFKRVSEKPYKVEISAYDVQNVANEEHKVPVEWINEAHNDILPPLYDYLYPLIQGEVDVKYKNGIPAYANIAHLLKER